MIVSYLGSNVSHDQDIPSKVKCCILCVSVLNGPEIQPKHCHIMNKNGQVVLFPYQGASCTLNGVPVLEPVPLSQGK